MVSNQELYDVEATWTEFRRSIPDPTAPNPPFLPRILFLLIIIPTIPYCIIRYLTIGPHIKWMTVSTYLRSKTVYWSGLLVDSAQLPPPPKNESFIPGNLPLAWVKEGRKDVDCEIIEIEGVGEEYRKGIGRVEGVKSVKRWGFMLTPKNSLGRVKEVAKDGGRVVLYFHGGSYTQGHPVKFPFPWQMTKALNMRVFGINYRLCLSPSTAFPAPILDGLSGYLHLTRTLHFDPGSIIFLGDSSGGHLALMVSRYLSDLSIPQPGFIALSSPLGDCTRSLPSRKEFGGIDILAPTMDEKPLKSALRHYSPQAGENPYFCPAKASGKDWEYLRSGGGTRVYIMVGTKEVLGDDGRRIVSGMKEGGVDVTMREDIDGVHCGPMAQFTESNAWEV